MAELSEQRAAADQRRYEHVAAALHKAVAWAEDAEARCRDLTARLARVEALAGEPTAPYPATCDCPHGMGFQFHRFPCRYAGIIPKAAVRAALTPGGSDD